MSEIKCPKCGEIINIDDTTYSQIARQVHDLEFDKSLDAKIKLFEENNKAKLELEKSKMLSEYEAQIKLLKNNEDNQNVKFELEKTKIKSEYEIQIKKLQDDKNDRDQVIDRLKNMDSQLSTKMVGETLEQHCEIEFDKLSLHFPKHILKKIMM